ncbi:hypothetical protein KC351_g7853 [Hortaea werneckii]|nr:hypothetical protein KC351_g7853 [Hortaea werneckii]
MGLFNRSNSSSDADKEKEDRGGAMHSIKEALGVRGKDEPAPDAAMKWGISPDKYPPPVYSKPEEEYTPEERAERQKQREKGVDPDLKAHMDRTLKGEGGFWTKFAGTTMGGGTIK